MFTFYTLAGVPISNDSGSEFFSFLLRAVLFLLFLLVFVFVCGYAWRTLPGLKAILPKAPEKRLKTATQITLADPDWYDEQLEEVEETSSTNPTRPVEIPAFNTYRDNLDAALNDHQPGAVVKAASEPGTHSPGPIIILRRPEGN